ncbi:MAG: tetratricopeptide repeat protein [Planctomycetes bacterium]|nr:tetratricopeptide repeat protein [Planctomycetota bacterium]
MARSDRLGGLEPGTAVRSARAGLLALAALAAGCAGPTPWGRAPAAEDRPTMNSDADPRAGDLADAAVAQGAARWREGDAAECERLLREALAREPNHRAARMLLADLLADQGRVDESERELGERLRVDPRDAQAHHSLGLLLESTGRRDEALAAYRDAVRHEPENPLYILSLETLRVASPAVRHSAP